MSVWISTPLARSTHLLHHAGHSPNEKIHREERQEHHETRQCEQNVQEGRGLARFTRDDCLLLIRGGGIGRVPDRPIHLVGHWIDGKRDENHRFCPLGSLGRRIDVVRPLSCGITAPIRTTRPTLNPFRVGPVSILPITPLFVNKRESVFAADQSSFFGNLLVARKRFRS